MKRGPDAVLERLHRLHPKVIGDLRDTLVRVIGLLRDRRAAAGGEGARPQPEESRPADEGSAKAEAGDQHDTPDAPTPAGGGAAAP